MKLTEYKKARLKVIKKLGRFFEQRGWKLVDNGVDQPVLEAPLTAGLHSSCPRQGKGGLRRRYEIHEVMKKPKEIRHVSLWCVGCQSYVALLMEAVDDKAAADQKLL